MIYNEKIEEIFDEIDIYVENDVENAQTLLKLKDKLNEIKKKMEKENSLVFVAEKGAGKTTIIDYITNLTFEREKEKKKDNKKRTKYIVEEDVLETGAGATTTSTVEIVQSLDKSSKLVVIPYKDDEVKKILNDFASVIFSKAHNIEDSKSIPQEILRAARNLTGLTEKKNIDGKNDSAMEMALKYDKNSFEDFEKRVIELANLDKRTITEFTFDSKDDELNWIKKTFRILNLVHKNDAPLPKKIILEISKEIFDFNKLDRINKIVDTRGLEVGSNTDRMDIKDLFRGEDNPFIAFVDKFSSPSKSIIDILGHYIYDDNMECINKLIYIVNFKNGEPEKVICSNGNVDNESEGISEKLIQISHVFRENEVKIIDKNILFCNAKKFLDHEGKTIVDIDDLHDYGSEASIREYKRKIRESEKENFIESINNIVERNRNEMEEELKSLIERYSEIKLDIDKVESIELNKVIDYINMTKLNLDISGEISGIYDPYLRSRHSSTIMAINNRYGIYSYNDIFCEGSNLLESKIKLILKNLKDNVIKLLKDKKIEDNLNDNQKNSIEFMIDDTNQYFFKYINKINEYFYNKLKNDIYCKEDDEFWEKVKNRWGKGSGYTNDVITFYNNQIIIKNYESNVNVDISNIFSTFKRGLISNLSTDY